MDFGLEGRTAVVTGGAGRIGSADCRILANEGANVVVLDVDADGADRVASEINEDTGTDSGTAMALECDLTDRDDVAASMEGVRDEFGGVDVLVNNAAMVDARSRVDGYDDDIWERDIEINLTGTYNVSKEVFPRMCERGWGRVVTMSSMAGWYGGFGQVSYSATKAAMIGLGRTMALEGAQSGVTSNVVAPNIVVGAWAEMGPDELREHVDEYYARIAEATPMRHLGTEEDVANMVAYLCSEQASYVTGQVIGVTGGVDLFSF
ncbi:putative oxidoreductase (short-chain dehydrogenase family) [Natrialba magadii ATCC 43099]|uniref:Oxidoreductase (Short-chain dehydrogenase family) n=1 Tax=Natrialba magadii (strain ATCC 43099 / DSM 3394 / CCM 3739 / CIP 104546 / IAM 13178 / JCM 8861 / NBRC 102185 / NCIMB 2190 / MS3) TaxID=547559 RepID=D3T059_NATMM|nr:SDR family NAD(P)-dependent oxidoreductase [Natrialba magadii]ADD04417.1 putative oxidoreductase (short-chain dehydrogenase family) [Natrialba magadii ATCC 43099]ELY25813.1 short-chain dehydrogenase/reductase SDR [Natrialba magadii ATCC 43099]